MQVSAHALKVARKGWSLLNVLTHGVTDYHPVIAVLPVETADRSAGMGAAKGSWGPPDVYEDGIATFVDGVIAMLYVRGLLHRDYGGTSLRDRLGAPAIGSITRWLYSRLLQFKKENVS